MRVRVNPSVNCYRLTGYFWRPTIAGALIVRAMTCQADNRYFSFLTPGVFLSCLVYSASVSAGVYRCTDDAGNVSFQQTACSFELKQEQIDLKFQHSRELAKAGNDQGFIHFMVENQLAGFHDSDGRSPLHVACTSPSSGACRWAITQGESLGHVDQSGLNALHHAARAGSMANVQYLLKTGLGIESLDEQGASALHHSILAGQLEVSMHLLKAGADPNRADHRGVTPLKLAVLNADQEAVRLLIRFGADPDREDGGTTPVDVATEHGRTDMLSTGSDSNLEVFSLDWLGPVNTTRNAQREFELTVDRYRRASKTLFAADDEHIGSLQSMHPMAAGDGRIVTSCAEIITTLSERLVVINFCHLGVGTADERLLRGVKSSAAQWYDRLVAVNPR
jgi:hypothetical protein